MKTNTTVSSSANSVFCEFCNKNTAHKYVHQELICSVCGCVCKDSVQWIYAPRTSESGVAMVPSSDNSRSYTSTKKDYTGKYVSSSIAYNLDRTYQKTKLSRPSDRSKYKGLAQIDRVSRLLELPAFLQNKVVEKFLDFNQKGYLRSRNMYSCTVALIVILANVYDVPISISEVLKITSVSRKRFNKEYFYLYYAFEQAQPTSASGTKHLEKFLSFVVAWPREKQFREELVKVLKIVNFAELQGRDSIVTSGAVILYLLKYYEYPYIDSLLKSLIINRLTLRNSWNLLTEQHPELKRYDTESSEIKSK